MTIAQVIKWQCFVMTSCPNYKLFVCYRAPTLYYLHHTVLTITVHIELWIYLRCQEAYEQVQNVNSKCICNYVPSLKRKRDTILTDFLTNIYKQSMRNLFCRSQCQTKLGCDWQKCLVCLSQ